MGAFLNHGMHFVWCVDLGEIMLTLQDSWIIPWIICAGSNFSSDCAKMFFHFSKGGKTAACVAVGSHLSACLTPCKQMPSQPWSAASHPPSTPSTSCDSPAFSVCVCVCEHCLDLLCRVFGKYTEKKFNTRLLVRANTAATASPNHLSLSEVFCPEFPGPNKPCKSTWQQWPLYAELC